MHIEFREVTLHNFLSFGHSSLQFNDDGFIRVTGINENPADSAVSNGSGKSSIWESVVWALTGDTIRGTKQVSNIYGSDGTYVELKFALDGKTYEILRSKDHKEYKTSLRIIIDGKDCSGKGIRDSEKLLAEYIPDITASLLGSVIILGQGLPERFTSNSPSGRKEVLEKLSKSDFMIEDLKARVTARLSSLQSTLRALQDKNLQLSTQKTLLAGQITQAQTTLGTLNGDELAARIQTLESEMLSLQPGGANIEVKIQGLQSEQQSYNNQLLELTTAAQQKSQAVKDSYKDALEKLENDSRNTYAQLTAKSSELHKIRNIKDVCPTCGQRLPDVHKPDTSVLETEVQDLQIRDNELKQQLNKLKLQCMEDVNATLHEADTQLSELKNKLTVVQTSISAEQRKLRQHNSYLNNLNIQLNDVKQQFAKLSATVAACNETIDNNTKQIKDIESQLLYNNSEEDLQQQHLEVVRKFDTSLKRDFRGYLLSTIIEYIQARAKAYSKIIFETDEVGFRLDGNNIEISYLNKAYENLSGGEKQKIDLIVQFSIRDMLCNHLGFTSNILVLDEVFDALDMIGCQRVLDVISSLSDIKNIFIVTHRKDLSIPTDKEIVVVKSTNGISGIQ